MVYEYRCNNGKCMQVGKVVAISKSLNLRARPEYCFGCKERLDRIFSTPNIKTGDGVK